MRFSCYEENFNYYRIVMTFDGWTRYGEKLHRATIYNTQEYRADERGGIYLTLSPAWLWHNIPPWLGSEIMLGVAARVAGVAAWQLLCLSVTTQWGSQSTRIKPRTEQPTTDLPCSEDSVRSDGVGVTDSLSPVLTPVCLPFPSSWSRTDLCPVDLTMKIQIWKKNLLTS